jgi:hypothetical protein
MRIPSSRRDQVPWAAGAIKSTTPKEELEMQVQEPENQRKRGLVQKLQNEKGLKPVKGRKSIPGGNKCILPIGKLFPEVTIRKSASI